MKIKARHRNKKQASETYEEWINIKPEKTVFFVIDMWDKHWCKAVNIENDELAPQINLALHKCRDAGIQIIHIPSDTMEFYNQFPQRQKMLQEPKHNTSRLLWYGNNHWFFKYGRFPISVRSDGGCACVPTCRMENMVWQKQHEAIDINENDLISDNPLEIFNYLKNRGIKNIIYGGIHLNICMLDRPIGMRKMNAKGFNCYLSRDLTEVMYNPKAPPKTTKSKALELVVKHVETYFAKSFDSTEIDLVK